MTILPNDAVLQRALDQGMLSAAQLESERTIFSRQAGATTSVPELLAHLVGRGLLSPWQVALLRAEEFGLRTVDLASATITDEALASVPRALAERFQLLPVSRQPGVLQVVVSDPLEVEGIDSVAHLLGLRVETLIAPADDIVRAIERWYGGEKDEKTESGRVVGRVVDQPKTIVAAAEDEDAPVIALVHALIHEAIERRASDIHLEPLAQRFRVRYRIDGVLVEASDPPQALQPAIISRVKIMANISIAERRLPQDGRIQLPHRGRTLDLRVSSLPTAHGESVVMRVLDQAGLEVGLPHLGFSEADGALVDQLISLPDGIVLVTGPTGSGKTTTLYSCLHHLNRADRKIITVEDPVEYQLNGINQVPVREDLGMTFGAALRAMLRQAPNVVMVGEIRDLETAEIAVNASLTGHMVFSTLHTNDAPGAVARLMDLGVKPFLLAASLRGILAQRLVRKLCLECRESYIPAASELRTLGIDETQAETATFMRAVGCPACGGTGFHGRIGIFEIFVINDEIRQMIHERAGPARLRAKARILGMCTLREDGARKVSAGLTTIGEVVSITAGDAS